MPLFNVRIYRNGKIVAGHGGWSRDGTAIFSFATQELRERFEAAAVEVVNGPELSWDEVVVRVRRVRIINR